MDDEPAAWMYGAAEALSVLSRRGPADRQRAAEYAIDLLIRHAEPADWGSAGLPAPVTAPVSAVGRVPLRDPAVLRLARAAMSLRCSTLRAVERPRMWARMAGFFAQVVPSEPLIRRMQSTMLSEQMAIGDVPGEVVEELFTIYEWYRDTYGRDAYLASMARTNLALAYCHRATGADLTDAEKLLREEIDTRTRRYGSEHPFVLVARNLLARCQLEQAEATSDKEERRTLALQAYAEADRVRAARDQIYGVTSANAVLSRRHQAHALLLLGEADDLSRASACLRYVLAFESARNENAEFPGSGQTQLLLARVRLALGDITAALDYARNAHRLLSADAPTGASCRNAAALVRELSGIHGDGETNDWSSNPRGRQEAAG